MVMEVFNLLLERRKNGNSIFKYHWRCSKLKITHMCLLDDLLIFSYVNCSNIFSIKEAFQEFSEVSGLQPNLNKAIYSLGM